MEKKVNICANIPVRTVRPMIYGNYSGITLKVEDIFTCICGRAIVDEILSDGSTIRLDLNNYNTVNDTVVEQKETEDAAMTPAAAPEVETPNEAIPDTVETVETVTQDDAAPTAEPVEAPVETKAQRKARLKAEAEAKAAEEATPAE